MSEISHLIGPFITHYGAPLLFFVAFFETLPFFGMLIPGATIIVICGYLIRLDLLPFGSVFLAVLCGAFVGDVCSYWLGRKKGYDFLKKFGKYVLLTEARLEAARNLVKKHPAKAIVFGRFNTLTRSLASFVSGASHVKFVVFVPLTLCAVSIWAFVHLLVGFVFGQWIDELAQYMGVLFFGVIVVVIALVYGYKKLNERYHIFKHVHTKLLVLMIGSLAFFTFLLQEVVSRQWIVELDRAAADFVQGISTPWLSFTMLSITRLCDVQYLLLFTIILSFYLFFHKKIRLAAVSITALCLGGLAQYYIKGLTNISRPDDSVVSTLYSSFPSGHSVSAMILGWLIVLSFYERFERGSRRTLFISIIAGLVFLVGASRIYLGAHWLSDVLGGFALGIVVMSFTLLLFRFVAFIKKLI